MIWLLNLNRWLLAKIKKFKYGLESHNIIVKMSRIQVKIKSQENHNFNEKRQSINVDTEMNRMLESPDKEFKAAITKKKL